MPSSDSNQLAAILKRANEAQDPQARKPPRKAAVAKVAPVTSPAKPPGRRSDPAYMQASAYVSKDVRRRVTAALALRAGSKDYSELVEELLIEWLENERA